MARLVDATGKPIPTQNCESVFRLSHKQKDSVCDETTGKINLAELGLAYYGQKDASFSEKYAKPTERANPLLTKKS
jgi:hypothetical protein